MKQLAIPALLMVLSFTACNNDKKISTTEKNADGSETKTSVDVKAMTNSADEMNQKMDALKALTPLSTDQLKALLPTEIDGIKQSEYNTSATAGYSVAIGQYKI